MCKILAHLAWYHGKVAPGYHGIFSQYGDLRLPPSVLFDSVPSRIRSSGERFSWFPRFFLGIRWVISQLTEKLLSFMHKTIQSDLFNEPSLVFFLFWQPHILPMLSAVRSPDSFYLACLPIHKVGKTFRRELWPVSMHRTIFASSCFKWRRQQILGSLGSRRPRGHGRQPEVSRQGSVHCACHHVLVRTSEEA